MKKITFFLSLLIIFTQTSAQKTEYRFTPKWKTGTFKKVIIVQQEKEYKKDILTSDTTIYLNAEMTVLKENPNDYLLKILYENVALRAAIQLYAKLGDELPKYRNLELIYRVDKVTGKSELVNWKEAKIFMNESFDQITSLIKKRVPEMSGLTSLIFNPIKEMFKNKKNMEEYMTSEIGYLLFPYDKKFTFGDTLKTTEFCKNPFNPTDTISQQTLSYLNNINESNKTCNINLTEILDLTGFKKMMRAMMEKMSKSFGASDSTKTKAAKEIDSVDFDISNLTVITFDYNSTWPSKIIKTAKVTAVTPKSKTEKTVRSTISIK